MLELHTPTVGDKDWIDPILAAAPTRACEYNFTSIYLYRDDLSKKVTQIGDRMVMRLFGGEQTRYLFPIGTGPLEPVIQAMAGDSLSFGGVPLQIICATHEFCQELENILPGHFRFEPDRKAFDYLYTVEKLAELKGKKLHGKRNHINRFQEDHPDWRFEPLTQDNLPECVAMDNQWFVQRRDEVEEKGQLGYENNAVQDALFQFSNLGLTGGLIRVDGQVVAFSMGDRLGTDTFDVHFEKAFGDIPGAYSIINREMARYVRTLYPDIVYLNREDDTGVEGLRKAKLSYHPDILLEKFTAYWQS